MFPFFKVSEQEQPFGRREERNPRFIPTLAFFMNDGMRFTTTFIVPLTRLFHPGLSTCVSSEQKHPFYSGISTTLVDGGGAGGWAINNQTETGLGAQKKMGEAFLLVNPSRNGLGDTSLSIVNGLPFIAPFTF